MEKVLLSKNRIIMVLLDLFMLVNILFIGNPLIVTLSSLHCHFYYVLFIFRRRAQINEWRCGMFDIWVKWVAYLKTLRVKHGFSQLPTKPQEGCNKLKPNEQGNTVILYRKLLMNFTKILTWGETPRDCVNICCTSLCSHIWLIAKHPPPQPNKHAASCPPQLHKI